MLTVAVDNSAHFDRMAVLRHICSQGTMGKPLPANMQALLLAMDADEIERDLATLLLQSGPRGTLRNVA